MIWTDIVQFANTGKADEFENLVEVCMGEVGGGIEDMEKCQGMATWAELAATHLPEIRSVLKWLSSPETHGFLADFAVDLLRVYNDTIQTSWVPNTGYDAFEPTQPLIDESPDHIGSVFAPVCWFIKRQIERHDIYGEKLRDVVPVGLCNRPDCGKFKVVKTVRPGPLYCSALCRATVHQAKKPKEAKTAYAKHNRAVKDRNRPKKLATRTPKERTV